MTGAGRGAAGAPLRPLILQPDSEPYGACRALLRAIRAMPAGSVRPIVVFPYPGAAVAEYDAAGCDVHVEPLAVLRRASASPAGLARLAVSAWATGRRIASLAAATQADLIHTNSMTVVTGADAAPRAGLPHVWQLREAPVERGARLRGLQVLLRRRSDLVIAVSDAAASCAPRGVALRVVRDGFDVPVPHGGPRDTIGADGAFVVAIIGRITPTKAPHVATTAAAVLARRGGRPVRVVVVGTVYPGYEQYAEREIVQAAAKAGLVEGDSLRITGWLDDVTPILRSIDALVIATASGEGFPGSVAEALAHGVPVVSCATGGVDELVLDGVTGIVCPPGDTTAVEAALERLCDDTPLAHRLGDGGRQHVSRFSEAASGAALLDAWRSVARP